jgi:glucosamine--fructose-6-phosphate aminotransferase (isomerizing)
MACERFRREGRGEVLTLCAYPGRSLTSVGAVNLILPAAQEQSVAQTRAFTCLALGALAATAIWAGREDLLLELARLPDLAARLLGDYAGQAAAIGRDLAIDRFYFLGSGPRYGLACELSLKLKEMTVSHSEPFHFLEFRHGPKAMAGQGALVFGLLSASSAERELAVLSEMRGLGARTLAVGPGQADIVCGDGVAETAAGLLALPFGQLIAFERAVARGLNPDAPGNLDVFVRL